MKSLKQSTAWGVLASAAVAVILAILADVDKWFDGPFKEIVVSLAGFAVMFIRATTIGSSYMNKGDDK